MVSARAVGFLREVLQPARLIEIFDIGANPVDGPPPYTALLECDLARVTGFEPQPAAFAELQKRQGASERYLPYAIGDGQEHELKICSGSGMTSLLEPDFHMLNHFEFLLPFAQVVTREQISTRRLDDIEEIEHLDYLKIDIQGSELSVFQNGREKLRNAVAIHTEVSFMPLYKDQPLFGQVDVELRDQGFVPHRFAYIKNCIIAPTRINGDPRQPLHQLLEADVVYVRDFTRPELMSDEQLKQLCLIADLVYGSKDLTFRCMLLLEQRGAIAKNRCQKYFENF